MNQSSASTVVASETRLEYTGAFLLLRLFLGLRTLLAGVEKFEANKSYSLENYAANMQRMAGGIANNSFIPPWAATTFAMTLGYLLTGLGALLLLGVFSRVTLFVTGLLYVGLSFGLMAVQEGEGVAWLAVQVLMFVLALLLVRHEKLALVRG